jgi:hypothetical protein
MVLALGTPGDSPSAGHPEILGGALIEYFPRSQAALLTYLCVGAEHRGRGLARELIDHAFAACAVHLRHSQPLMLAEIEDASASTVGSRAHHEALQRYRVFDALGFRRLPYSYRQPPLATGLPWVDDLHLVVHAPDGRRTVPRSRLETFLAELEESLGVAADRLAPGADPGSSAATGGDADRIESRSLIDLLPAEERPTLGVAAAITVRYTFFQPPESLRPDLDLAHAGPHRGRMMALEDLVGAATAAAPPEGSAAVLEPMRSFVWDTTLSEQGSRRLPLVTPCVGPSDPAAGPEVIIHFPPVIVTRWEGSEVETALAPSERTLVARLVDATAVFATNHVAYLLGLVFGDPDGDRSVSVRATQIVALMALADGTSASMHGTTAQLADMIEFELDGVRLRLHEFATARLRALALAAETTEAGRAGLRREFDALDMGSPRPVLPAVPAGGTAPEGAGAVGLVLRTLAEHGGDRRAPDVRAAIARCVTLDATQVFGATCEIQDLDRMAEVEAAIAAARSGSLRCNEFTRQLAGLSQGVIDHQQQDRSEVEDSLELASEFGGSVHFIQRRAAVRLSGSTRSYEKMRLVVGGCPYFLLATLCAMFNEHLISSAAREVARLRPSRVRLGRWISLDGRHAADELVRIERRFLFYERFFAETIPNLFRYQSERRLFEELEAKRGMAHQRDQGRRVLDQIDEYWRSRNQQAQEWINSLLATAIFGLTLWQVFGVTWEAGREAAEDVLVVRRGFEFAGTLSSFLALPLLAIAMLVSVRFLRSFFSGAAERRAVGRRVTVALLVASLVLIIGAMVMGALPVPAVPGRP